MSGALPIQEIMTRALAINTANGWWPDDVVRKALENDADHWLVRLALVHAEVSEAVEDIRDGNFQEAVEMPKSKPIGLPSELADIVIRVCDAAAGAGIDLAGAIDRKLAYNATRAYKHGGKAR